MEPGGGVVDVTVTRHTVSVADRGPGIDPTEATRLFERFYRAPAARGRPGSGLGLAIVRQVADSHGATATIRQREGGGTVASLAFGEQHSVAVRARTTPIPPNLVRDRQTASNSVPGTEFVAP